MIALSATNGMKVGEVGCLIGRKLSMTLDGAFAMFHMRAGSVLVMEKSAV